MAFGVSSFKSNLYNSKNGGGARPSLFQVDIDTIGTSFTETDNLLVKAAAIPGRTINPVTVNWFGRAYKFTGNSTYDIWTVTIMNDENFSQRNKILEWMRSISGQFQGNRTATHGGKVGGGAVSTATVTQLNSDGKSGQSWKFVGLWPSSLGEIALDWSNDTVQEYTIGVAYDYFIKSVPSGITGADSTGAENQGGGSSSTTEYDAETAATIKAAQQQTGTTTGF